MNVFVAQLISLVFKKIFFMEFLFFALLFPMSLAAETSYLFPSDMIKQAKQATYETKSAQRYSSPRYGIYPKDIRTNTWPVDKIPAHIPTYTTQNASRHNPAQIDRYPANEKINQFNKHIYKPSLKMAPIPTPMERDEQYTQKYPHLLYVSDLKADNDLTSKKSKVMQYSSQIHSRQEYPNLLYASDIEPDRRLSNQKANNIQYSLHKTKEQKRLIPGSLFSPYQRNAPGMLQGVFSGAISPGYTYLSPYNDGGLNNTFLNQSIPFTGYMIFPEQWNSPGNQ